MSEQPRSARWSAKRATTSLKIVGVGVAPSRGIKKGVVVNVVEATSAIKASIEKAERSSGYEIARAFVSVTGGHVSAINSRGVVGVNRGDKGITADDVGRALDAARAIAIPQDREVLHVIPRGYSVDGQDGVKEPVGMIGFRLEVEAHIVTGQASSIHNLMKCVESCNVGVDGLVLDPIASGEAVLTNTEKEMGVVLADIGGGTTDVAIFIEGSVWHTTVLPVGGNHITNDVAVGMRVPFDAAEQLKIEYGHARHETIDPTEVVQVKAFGDGGVTRVQRRDLAEIIEARTEEIYQLILQEIKRSGYDGLLPAGVVHDRRHLATARPARAGPASLKPAGAHRHAAEPARLDGRDRFTGVCHRRSACCCGGAIRPARSRRRCARTKRAAIGAIDLADSSRRCCPIGMVES